MASWKTTLTGIITLLAAIFWAVGEYLQVQPPVITDLSGAVAAVTAAIGLIFARDHSSNELKESRR